MVRKLLKNVYNSTINLPKYFNKKHIFIACFEKSASSYLLETLHKITGYKKNDILIDHRKEQDIDEIRLIGIFYMNTISRQHMRAWIPNIKLLNKANIKPVVLVRNIFDIIVSVRDHIYFTKEDREGDIKFSGCNFFELSEKKTI